MVGIVGEPLSSAHGTDVVLCAHTGVVDSVAVVVGYEGRLGPIGLDGDGGDPFWHIPVVALVENTAADAVEVLVGAIAVGVVVVGCIGWRVVVGGDGEAARRAARDGGYHPPHDHAVVAVVLGAHVVVVGQLHLGIVEVEVVGVFVGDDESGVGGGDGGAFGFLEHCAVAYLDVYRQGAELLAFVAVGLGAVIYSRAGLVVHHRGVAAPLHEHGVGMVAADAVGQHDPLHDQGGVGHIAGDPPSRHFAVTVEQLTEELKALQEACFGQQSAVIVYAGGLHIGGFGSEVVEVTQAVGVLVDDAGAVVDGRAAGGGVGVDVAVEQAAEDHRAQVVLIGSVVVVAHKAAHAVASGDVGVGVAVHHAWIVGSVAVAVEQAHQTAAAVGGVGGRRGAGAAHRAREYAHVVDAGRAARHASHGAHLAALADVDTLQHHVADRAGEGREEGLREACEAVGHVGRGVDGGLEGAAEGGNGGEGGDVDVASDDKGGGAAVEGVETRHVGNVGLGAKPCEADKQGGQQAHPFGGPFQDFNCDKSAL